MAITPKLKYKAGIVPLKPYYTIVGVLSGHFKTNGFKAEEGNEIFPDKHYWCALSVPAFWLLMGPSHVMSSSDALSLKIPNRQNYMLKCHNNLGCVYGCCL